MKKLSRSVRVFAMSALATGCLFGSTLAHANKWEDSGSRYAVVSGQVVKVDSAGNIMARASDAGIGWLGMVTHCSTYGYPYAPATVGLWCHDYENPIAPNTYVVYKSVSGTNNDTNVYFYDDEDYRGSNYVISMPDTRTDLSKSVTRTGDTWNRRIRSIRIPHGLTVWLCDDKDLRGTCLSYQGDNRSLGGFNAKASSLRVFITQRQN